MNKVSGYTEIKLADGKSIPLKFGMWTFRELCKKWNVNLVGFFAEADKRLQEDELSTVFDLIGTAAEYASRINGEGRALTDVEISMALDESYGLMGMQELVSTILLAIKEAIGADVNPEQSNEAGNVPAPAAG